MSLEAAEESICDRTGGLAEDGAAGDAEHDGLSVAEDSGDGEAAGALDVHEEAEQLKKKKVCLIWDEEDTKKKKK